MGQHISAIVFCGAADQAAVTRYDARLAECDEGFSLVAIDAYYVDAWAERLEILGAVANQPTLNFRVVHHIAHALSSGRPFAIIETDYFGGIGTQSAAVYHGEHERMSPTRSNAGVINQALRLLGLSPRFPLDEFATLGLEQHRDWDEFLEDYWDE